MIRDVTWNTFGRRTLERIDSEDGHEIVMATNYLGRVGTWEDDDFNFIQHFHMYIFMIVWTFAGPFLLTHLLLDKVMSSGGAPGGGGDSRLIHVSSDAHLTKFDFEGLKFYL